VSPGFRLRQVSQRLSGGAIVRERDLGPGPIRVGRGTDCDIEIPDLSVGLHQLTITAAGPRAVHLAPAPGAATLIDGRPLAEGRVALERDRSLALGRFRLVLAPDPERPDGILVTLEQIRAEESPPEKLTPPVAGRRAAAWALALAVLLAFLAAPVVGFLLRPLPPVAETAQALAAEPRYAAARVRADRSWNSGALSSVHAPLVADCKACHQQALVSVTDSSCRACHVSAHDHAEPARLLASMASPPPPIAAARALANLPPGRCTVCHTEHEGAALRNNPATSDCAACHAALDSSLPDTVLKNASDWQDDHPQFRPGVVSGFDGGTPRLQLVSLDARPEDRNGLAFSHAQHLSRRNAVARMAERLPAYGEPLGCGDCHRADARGIGFLPLEMERDCSACHSLAVAGAGGALVDLPHAEPDRVVALLLGLGPAGAPRPAVAGGARAVPGGLAAAPGAPTPAVVRARAPFQPGGACHGCHDIGGGTAPGRLDFRIAPVHLSSRFYGKSLFPHGQHDDVRCSTCHRAESSERATDLLLPGIATCRECHGNARWAARHPEAEASGACATCHWFHPDSRAPAFSALEERARGVQVAMR
jgi:hypothetical protein